MYLMPLLMLFLVSLLILIPVYAALRDDDYDGTQDDHA